MIKQFKESVATTHSTNLGLRSWQENVHFP